MVVGFGCPEVGLGILNRRDLNVLIRPLLRLVRGGASSSDVALSLFRMLARSNVMLGLALTFVFTTPVCDVVHRQKFVL